MHDPFSFNFVSEGFNIYSYTEEAGLLAHQNCSEVDSYASYTFLVNAPLETSKQVLGLFAYVFYLDATPVIRKSSPQNYQLVYSDEPCNQTFERWVETVIRYLCACNSFNGMPAFDWHDLASVLLEVRQHRLHFNIVPFAAPLILSTNQVSGGGFNRLLAVVFASVPIRLENTIMELERYRCLGEWVVEGGAFHPYEETLVMLLGDSVCSEKPNIAIKNELLPGDFIAIY